MHIKSVTMTGFKSYADKTVIRGMDRNFTAITGTNGSGKSNIIDAIIFALDLGTAGKMRAGSMKELINSQRSECCVAILFDNTGGASSPTGYEHFEEIEVFRSLDSEGKSKYRINGHACTKSSIEAFCRSIGITDNFVVLQGHITKILNMKSTELRGMIEEAAGTKSYNAEKIRACEALKKKEEKLREVKECLRKSVAPFVSKLSEERAAYESERSLRENKDELKRELKEAKAARESADLAIRMNELRTLLGEWDSHSAALSEVEDRMSEIDSKGEIEDLVGLKGRMNELHSQLEECNPLRVSQLLDAARRELELLGAIHLSDILERKEHLLGRERILEDEMCNGGVDKISELEKLRYQSARLEAEVSQIKLRDARALLPKQFPRELLESTRWKEETSLLRKYVAEMGQCSDGMATVETVIKYNSELRMLNRRLEEYSSGIRAKLSYPLIPGVYGTVDENYSLCDPRYEEAIAVILGSRSKFVICENDEVAAEVLKRSYKRVSCIPLNKIARVSPVHAGGINAMDVILYDKAFEKAFQFIFGGYFIFEDKREAEKCCSEKRVMCITLDGMVYDPRGTLTGGAPPYREGTVRSADMRWADSIIRTIQVPENDLEEKEWMEACKRMHRLNAQLKSITERIELLERLCGDAVNIKSEIKSVRDEIQALQVRERRSREQAQSKASLERQIHEMEAELKEKERQTKSIQEELQICSVRLREAEERNGTRRVSVHETEALELKRKQLVRETMRLSSHIERVCTAIQEVFPEMDLVSHTGPGVGVYEARENTSNAPPPQGNTVIAGTKSSKKFTPRLINRACLVNVGRTATQEELNGLDKQIEELQAKLGTNHSRCTVDPKNFELLDMHVEMVQDLEQKIGRLEEDRHKIMQSIERLSMLGAEANRKAFASINRNLGRFFKYFVSNSEVVIEDNFEIRIKMDGWVDSLAELSGGQRSLVALSLLFSMLAYNPAPLYIFDEIDAALDLNYTQSIGEIIKREFKEAQFLVVSLKSNMFDNANRIYRVYLQENKPKISQIR